MKTKIMTGVLAGVISSAAFAAPDVAAIKAACQSSDKTIWVEKNQICIPANPCTSDNMSVKQYCDQRFSNYQTPNDNIAKGMVELYALGRLECRAVDVQHSLFDQDYVTCIGNDVMVFEFDDTRNIDMTWEFSDLASYVCDALGGENINSSGDRSCLYIGERECNEIERIMTHKYDVPIHGRYNPVPGSDGLEWPACLLLPYHH